MEEMSDCLALGRGARLLVMELLCVLAVEAVVGNHGGEPLTKVSAGASLSAWGIGAL